MLREDGYYWVFCRKDNETLIANREAGSWTFFGSLYMLDDEEFLAEFEIIEPIGEPPAHPAPSPALLALGRGDWAEHDRLMKEAGLEGVEPMAWTPDVDPFSRATSTFTDELGRQITLTVERTDTEVVVRGTGPDSDIQHTWTYVEALILRHLLATVVDSRVPQRGSGK